MDVGVHITNFDFPGGPASIRSVLAEAARAAEAAGVANLSVMDHYLQMDVPELGGPLAPMLEGYTTLGYLAGKTETVDLQLLVTGVTYRHPALLAKIVTTLDVLSGEEQCSGSGLHGMSASTTPTAFLFRHCPSASRDSRRRCRSCIRCGGRMTGRSRAFTTSWQKPSTPRSHCIDRAS